MTKKLVNELLASINADMTLIDVNNAVWAIIQNHLEVADKVQQLKVLALNEYIVKLADAGKAPTLGHYDTTSVMEA